MRKQPKSVIAMIMDSIPEGKLNYEDRDSIERWTLKWFYDRKKLLPDFIMFDRYVDTLICYGSGEKGLVDYLSGKHEYNVRRRQIVQDAENFFLQEDEF